MKRRMPWSEPVDLISSDDSSSSDAEMDANNGADGSQTAVNVTTDHPIKEMTPELIKEMTPELIKELMPEPVKEMTPEPLKEITPEGMLFRRAEMYQEYMKQLPIPTQRGSAIPFYSWVELGKSIKQLYGQPLHYLTNILLKQWDQLRIGSVDEYTPLDMMIHPCKAEANIWLVEEVHRRTTSHYHVAKLWSSDPMHHAFVDSIFPQL